MRYTSDAHRVIVTSLGKHLRQSLDGRDRVAIPCPFHQETQPSLYVNLVKHPGSYFCFGCGAKPSTHGGWNGLAALLGLPEITDGMIQRTHWHPPPKKGETDTRKWDTWAELLELWNIGMEVDWQHHLRWRGMPGWLMTVVGSRLGYDDDRDEQCVLWPVVVDGETVGGIKAKMKPTARTRVKYLNAPGPWVKTQALWPYDVVHQMLARQPRGKRTVVLVEGPRDALRLIGCGIPALAILGSNNWTTAKRDLLAQLDPDRVLFGMDSDAAGTKAFKLVAPTLKGYCVRKRMRYQEPGDPCSVSIDQIRRWIVAYKIPLAPLV